jgi:cytosine/uracil/thiamine/allantoin permease
MIFDPSTRKMAANILALILTFFHPAYYNVFPQDKGVMLSLPIVFFLYFTKHSVVMLSKIRKMRYLRWSMTLACVIMAFIPHLLPLAISLAFVVEFSYLFPKEGMENFYKNHAGEKDVDKKFIDAYFN